MARPAGDSVARLLSSLISQGPVLLVGLGRGQWPPGQSAGQQHPGPEGLPDPGRPPATTGDHRRPEPDRGTGRPHPRARGRSRNPAPGRRVVHAAARVPDLFSLSPPQTEAPIPHQRKLTPTRARGRRVWPTQPPAAIRLHTARALVSLWGLLCLPVCCQPALLCRPQGKEREGTGARAWGQPPPVPHGALGPQSPAHLRGKGGVPGCQSVQGLPQGAKHARHRILPILTSVLTHGQLGTSP